MATVDSYPPDLTPQEIERLRNTVEDFAIAHGLTVWRRIPNADNSTVPSPAPVTLFPSPFPRLCFEEGRAVQKAYNELYAAISQDEEFLTQIVKEIGESDGFIQELWKVHLRVKEGDGGYVQHLSLGLFRSDYMIHQEQAPGSNPQIKQVEFNTIASSFGGLSSQTTQLHRFLSFSEYPMLEKPLTSASLSNNLPDNGSIKGLAQGIRHAFVSYGEAKTRYSKCVLFIVQDEELNIFDQRHLEYDLSSSPQHIPVFRLKFSHVLERTSLAEGAGRELLFTPTHQPALKYEAAVVYLRSGYGPADYKQSGAWDARFHLERSAAIKCPSVLTQVAGTKKVQQVLATPTADSTQPIIHRFIPPPSSEPASSYHSTLENTFTAIYPMDASPAGMEARAIALDPKRCISYVLKPQREGGGNNIYRSAIPAFLRSIPEDHWGAYILMQLIMPPPRRNTILRGGEVKVVNGDVISELGVYGTCLWDQRKKQGDGVKWNEYAGYLLRTKDAASEEGGVAAGFGCMDSVALVD